MEKRLLPQVSTTSLGLSVETTREIKEWPTEAHGLEERQRDWTLIVYDMTLIGVSLGLLAKAMVVFVFGSASVDVAVVFIEFNQQLVTLFTIVFATIVSTLVRRYALWKAERGATLGQLEQLHSSVSLPKTLTLVWSLRSFTTTSIMLVLIWSFYYLGSQAISREYRSYDSDIPINLPIAYPNTSSLSIFEMRTPSSIELSKMNGQFISAVLDVISEKYQSEGSEGWD
jgi:hypothetical protein